MDRQSTDDFQGREIILYDIAMVDTYQYTFVKTPECTEPRVKLNVNKLCILGANDMSVQVHRL